MVVSFSRQGRSRFNFSIYDDPESPAPHVVQDFGLLYAPISTSPDFVNASRSPRWLQSGPYWHFVLFTWNVYFRKEIVRTQCKFDKLTTPFLDNVDISYAYRGRTLAGAANPLQLEFSGRWISSKFAPFQLQQKHFQAFYDHLIQEGQAALAPPLLQSLMEPQFGPVQAVCYYSAFHAWVFNSYEIAELSVACI
ncbi:uncharacterized protein CCR75_000119 [Bremia lactucae]|uniref:Uncharacterized protein n=1 Tax=Bremia lactucae TaxID=4779 RepID=A0A976IIP0_BRELC|nr:hypothetical protein CCR75_000119 [Bremia lactucae]